MIANPRKGDIVQIWYRTGVRDGMPWHGAIASVEIAGRDKPRNHGVRPLDSEDIICVPCGNLREQKGC